MVERIAKMAEQDDIPVIDSVYGLNKIELAKTITDPFAMSAEETKSLAGTQPNFKRKVTNELKKYNRGVDGTSSRQIDDEREISGYDAFKVVSPPYNPESFAEIYLMSPAHYSAVNAKVANIVGLGFKLVDSTATKRRLEKLTDESKLKRVRAQVEEGREDLFEILENLNEEETFTEVLIKVWRDYESMGNGYIEIARKKDGTIGYVGHIPGQTIRIRRERDGFVQIAGRKAEFFRNFGDDKTRNPISTGKTNEILHIKRYAPGNTYYGVPDVAAAMQAITGNEFASRYNLEYFENKAVPRYLITLKGANLGAAAQQDLLSFFETGLKGQNHRSLFIPLPSDDGNNKVEFDIEAVEASNQDSSFKDYGKNNRNEILMAHRVPISKVSTADGASLAIARDADKTFKEQVCQPEQKILEKKLNRIVKEFTNAFELKLNEMTLTDANTQSQIDERMVKNGIWLPNEVRARDGMSTLSGGDERVDLNAKDKIAQQTAEANATRQRDAERSAGASDSAGEARQPKGDGRATG
jgi:PBSX family phage portal protein